MGTQALLGLSLWAQVSKVSGRQGEGIQAPPSPGLVLVHRAGYDLPPPHATKCPRLLPSRSPWCGHPWSPDLRRVSPQQHSCRNRYRPSLSTSIWPLRQSCGQASCHSDSPSPRDRGRHCDRAPPSPLARSPASICSSADRDPTWFSKETVPTWRRLRRSTHTPMPSHRGAQTALVTNVQCHADGSALPSQELMRSFSEKKCQTCPLGSIPSNMTLAPGGQGHPRGGTGRICS